MLIECARPWKFTGDDATAAIVSISPDLQLSVVKAVHAKWLIQSFEAVNNTSP